MANNIIKKVSVNGTEYDNDNPDNYLDIYSTDDQIVGRWVDGSKIHKKTVMFNKMYPITDAYRNYDEDISDWYKCPYLNPNDGMMVFKTEPFWHWANNADAETRGCGNGCQMSDQAWIEPTKVVAADIFASAGENKLQVRIGANAKVYLIAVTFYYYKLDKS